MAVRLGGNVGAPSNTRAKNKNRVLESMDIYAHGRPNDNKIYYMKPSKPSNNEKPCYKITEWEG